MNHVSPLLVICIFLAYFIFFRARSKARRITDVSSAAIEDLGMIILPNGQLLRGTRIRKRGWLADDHFVYDILSEDISIDKSKLSSNSFSKSDLFRSVEDVGIIQDDDKAIRGFVLRAREYRSSDDQFVYFEERLGRLVTS